MEEGLNVVDMYKVMPPIRKKDYWEASRYRSLSGELSVVAATAWGDMPWAVRIESDFRGAGQWEDVRRIQIRDVTVVPFVMADTLALIKTCDHNQDARPLLIRNAILVMYGSGPRGRNAVHRSIDKHDLARRLKQYPWPLGDQASRVLEMEGLEVPV